MANQPVLSPASVLVIDDEPDLRTLYELTLLREGYQVTTAGTVAQAREALQTARFNLVITDMRLPDGMGTEILNDIKAQQRAERCLVITAYGSAENAVESLKAGAFDYLTKPVDLKQFRTVVAEALRERQNRGKGIPATAATLLPSGHRPPPKPGRARVGDIALDRLAGESAAMRSVKDRIIKVAKSMAPVLVRGESGTGKELVASALHANSHRSDGPWIAVNCGAIPENLLETEFFGSKKGSYTGANQDRDGFFRAASGGTLFLDEIGDLPLAMQAKLLRAIQERCIRPVGANQEEPVDVRIVSATHKDLAAEVAAGSFRQDLFYRLNVIDIYIPPLRDRCEDLPTLCESLLQRIAMDSGQPIPFMPAHVLQQLAQLPLAGNVRELENLLHRAMALSDEGELQLDEPAYANTRPSALVPLPLTETVTASLDTAPSAVSSAVPSDLQSHLDQQERDILVRTLNETGFNRTLAANRLGLSLRQIRYRIARLKIVVPLSSDGDADA